jgi:hypothetical protein
MRLHDLRPVRHVERDGRFRLDLFRHDVVFAQNVGQRHRETGGVGRADQLFGVRARLVLKSLVETILHRIEHTRLGGNRAVTFLKTALPFGGPMFADHVTLLSLKSLNAGRPRLFPCFLDLFRKEVYGLFSQNVRQSGRTGPRGAMRP